MLERKVEVGTDLSKRVNMSIVAMTLVNTWRVYKMATMTISTQKSFYMALTEELVDNGFDGNAAKTWLRQQSSGETEIEIDNVLFRDSSP